MSSVKILLKEILSFLTLLSSLFFTHIRPKGDVKKARKIRELVIPEIKKVVCIDRSGLKSILLGCALLEQINLDKRACLNVYSGRSLTFQVYYNYDPSLPDMFFVKQTHDLLGVDKELSLYKEALREYFKDTFMDHIDLKISLITMSIGDAVKDFYKSHLGVIWNEEDCVECVEKALVGGELGKECRKLLDNKCYEKFRNHPSFVFKKKKEEKKIVEELTLQDYSDKAIVVRGDSKDHKEKMKELGGKYNPNLQDGGGWIFSKKKRDVVQAYLDSIKTKKNTTKEVWSCPDCMLDNPTDSNICRACEYRRV